MAVTIFGKLADGTEIREAHLATACGCQARILELGATLRDLVVRLPGGSSQRVVLGFETLDTYDGPSHHAGAIVGRCANRIAHGRFSLDRVSYQLPLNENGRHSLHSGPDGFDRRAWRIVEYADDHVTLALFSPAGDQGFPGALSVWCRYQLRDPATLALELTATTDATTIVNLAHHPYFNLDGGEDARDHELMIAADFITPSDRELIPTGEIVRVAGTPYDFRTMRRVRQVPSEATQAFGYDTNFVLRRSGLAGGDGEALAHASTLASPVTGLALELWTSAPGLQFFDCHDMHFTAPGLGGRRYGEGAGIALEAQHFPDSANHPHFPSTVLRPGEILRQCTEYRFRHTGR
ncbi:MAG: galactose mutarotase [Hyphomicrobiales bacterium]|nr:galactose mutarotase [Hyphomicrobiales bacterium]MBV8429062.1 galactose mutarotase [Hyphomicrobiales bacterium]